MTAFYLCSKFLTLSCDLQKTTLPKKNLQPRFSGSCEIDFLDLLEKEEADFAEQIRRQKSFLQSVFKDKEDLAQVRKNAHNTIL